MTRVRMTKRKGPRPRTYIRALKLSIGHGYVELSNREPLRLDAGKLDDLKGGQGRIEIRAAPGVVPVLEIGMEPGKHFLTTGSSISLYLTGLDIRVNYKDSGGAAGATPVIQAAGPVHLDRCAFRVLNGARPEGCSAVSLEGKELTVDGCWFQGFDRAIRIHAYHGTYAIRQTMVVSGSPVGPMPSPAPDWYGWGVEVRLEQGVGRRLLELEDCTFEGAGLLDLIPATVPLPLDVVVKRSAVRARAILAFPQELQAARLNWQGQGNHLEILEKGWIVLSSRMGTPALSSSVIDPESWSKVVGVVETGAIRDRVNYRATPNSRRLAQPRDFAIDVPDAPGTKLGADSEQVGPWGR